MMFLGAGMIIMADIGYARTAFAHQREVLYAM
jgi:hypothetical protein